MNKKIKSVLEKIEENGFEAYIVGGYVRDYILGIEKTDIDIATNALPKDLMEIFENCDSSNSQYGAVKFITDEYNFDITTYRQELEYIGRKPSKTRYVSDLALDLERRDFTINTLAMNSNGKIIDLLGAKDDIEKKIIRCVGDVDKKIKEDPLRILRALRFAIILDFQLEDNLLASIINNKELIKTLSLKRKKDELDHILASSNAVKGLELLKSLDILNLLGIGFTTIKYVSDICGMYSQLNIFDAYPFSNSEKDNIKAIKEITSYGKIDNYILFHYGLYNSIVAGAIMDIDTKKINELYNNLPIKSLNDIVLSTMDIAIILDISPSAIVKNIMMEIKKEILAGNLENNKEKIKNYIIINKRKWFNEGDVG